MKFGGFVASQDYVGFSAKNFDAFLKKNKKVEIFFGQNFSIESYNVSKFRHKAPKKPAPNLWEVLN